MEAWNPGKLPQGMTIAKLNKELNKEHTANHVNPVLDHPITLLAISSKWEQELLILSTIVWSMDFASQNSTKMMIFVIVIWRMYKNEYKKIAISSDYKKLSEGK